MGILPLAAVGSGFHTWALYVLPDMEQSRLSVAEKVRLLPHKQAGDFLVGCTCEF